MSRLSRVVLIIRDVEKGIRFYRDGLGLPVTAQTQSFARLQASPTSSLDLNSNQSEAQCATGYSPLLTFDVEDMDTTIPRLISLGAVLDGPIRYEPYGKVAAVRSPDGHMVGLYESANLPDGGDTAVAAAAAAKNHLASQENDTRKDETTPH